MPEWLQQAMVDLNIVFFAMSAIIGGFVGASLKLVFEVILADRYRQSREVKVIIAKYRNPILNAADALCGRIDNLLRMSYIDWFTQSEYYRISTLYVFCSYFAWIELLFGRLTLFHFETSRQNKRLNHLLLAVDKAFNNRAYFKPLPYSSIPNDTDLPKFICKALGEITVRDLLAQEPSCLGFVEFWEKYKQDDNFRAWLKPLEDFLSGIKDEVGNLKWDRLHLIELSLIGLINFLDPLHEVTRKYHHSETQTIFRKIHHENARQLFSSDVVKKRIPIMIESTLENRKRRILERMGRGYKQPAWESPKHNP